MLLLLVYHIGIVSRMNLFLSYAICTHHLKECVLKLFEESGNVISL